MDQIGPEQHPDLAADITQRGGQALAVLATLGEAAARLAAEQRRRAEHREQQREQQRQRQQQLADKLRQQDQLARHAAARQHAANDRRLIARTLDPRWATQAPLYDLATTWRTARIREHEFPEACTAAETVEQRLRDMYTHPMHLYDQAVRHGVPRFTAMRTAAAEMAHTPVMRPHGPGTRAGALDAAGEPPVVGDAAFTAAVANEQIRLTTDAEPDEVFAELQRLGPGGQAAADALRDTLAQRAAQEAAQAQTDAATPDDPRTPHIDENQIDGRPRDTTDTGNAKRDTATAERTAAQLAAEWYPNGPYHPHAIPPDLATRRPATTTPTRTAGRTTGRTR